MNKPSAGTAAEDAADAAPGLIPFVSNVSAEGSGSTSDVLLDSPPNERSDLRVQLLMSRIRQQLFDVYSPVTLDRYVIKQVIGQGGMGAVYLAEDPMLLREVAIKVSSPDEDSRLALREARIAARIIHPNVVSINDVGEWEGRVYIVMEVIKGETCRRWLQRERRAPREILGVFVDAGRGLDAIHRGQCLHGDFNPSNIMVDEGGRVKVVDFGMAARLSGRLLEARTGAGTSADMGLPESEETARRSLGGTPWYIAPELLRGGEPDARADQYSFCVSLYECLYDRHPYALQESLESEMHALVRTVNAGVLVPPRPLPGVSRRAVRAIARGLSQDRANRFASMSDLLEELVAPQWHYGQFVAGVIVGMVIFLIAQWLFSPL